MGFDFDCRSNFLILFPRMIAVECVQIVDFVVDAVAISVKILIFNEIIITITMEFHVRYRYLVV